MRSIVNHLLIFSGIAFWLCSCQTQTAVPQNQNHFQYQSIWDMPIKKQSTALKSSQVIPVKNIPSPKVSDRISSKIKIALVLPMGKDIKAGEKILDGFLISFWYSPKIFKEQTTVQIYNEEEYKKNLASYALDPSTFIVKPVLNKNDVKNDPFKLGEKAFAHVYEEIKRTS